jgi:hypothetical protein
VDGVGGSVALRSRGRLSRWEGVLPGKGWLRAVVRAEDAAVGKGELFLQK